MTLAPGTRIGGYEITGRLGEGGMGEVFRARDTSLDRDVAIKVLPEAFAADRERLARFDREARLLAQLNHPNVAQVYGVATLGETRALVLELVEGPTLEERLAEGPLPVDEALAVARQVAEALEEAHEKGIVHRDLKPANVKLSPDGKVKVLDFGLAKALDPAKTTSSPEASHSPSLLDSPTLTSAGTQMGVILGTAAYMAPEQARGRAVDRRADIWAFGVLLFEMLTGRRLFAGETVSDTLAAVLRQEVDWSLLPKDLAPSDRRLLQRCLERDPKRRLRDIGEARLALEYPAPSTDSATTVPQRAPGRARWLLPLVAAAGLAAGFGLARAAARPPAERPTIEGLRITPVTNSGNVIQASVSPDGRYVSYVESEQGLQSLWLQQLSGGQTLRLLPDRPVAFWGQTFSPDGNAIYFGLRSDDEPRGALFSISTLGGTPRRLLGDLDSAVTFSPDGRRIAFLRLRFPGNEETALMVAGADGSDPRPLATFRLPELVAGIFHGGPSWSPDGRHVATAVGTRGGPGTEGRARLVLVGVEDGKVTTLADPGWDFAAHCGWLPDGRSLLVVARGRDQPSSQLWSVSHPEGEVRKVTNDLNDRRLVSLTADGGTLVSVAGAITSSIWSVPLRGTGRTRRMSRATTDGIGGLAFADDGKLVYTSATGHATGLWATGADGAERGPLLELPAGDQTGFPTVADDGTVFFAVRGRTGVEIHALERGGSAGRVVVRDALFVPFEVARDGSFLVYTAWIEGVPRVLRVSRDGSNPRPVFDGAAMRPALHPSGRTVAFYHLDPSERFRLGVSSVEGGSLLLDVPAEPPVAGSRLLLRDEGIYLNTLPNDRGNVWLLPTAGGPARKLTAWDDQMLFDFAISRDGSTIAVSRGPRLRDAQVLNGFATTREPER